VTKKDWKWGFFGIGTGIAISIIGNNLNTDTIRGLVIGLIIGVVGGMFVSDKLREKKDTPDDQA